MLAGFIFMSLHTACFECGEKKNNNNQWLSGKGAVALKAIVFFSVGACRVTFYYMGSCHTVCNQYILPCQEIWLNHAKVDELSDGRLCAHTDLIIRPEKKKKKDMTVFFLTSEKISQRKTVWLDFSPEGHDTNFAINL